MRLPGAKRLVERAQQRSGEVMRGAGRSIIRVAAGRAADQAFADTRRLPCKANTTALQNSSGQFLNIPGYSMPGGPDVGS
jgi:hypothetical protein